MTGDRTPVLLVGQFPPPVHGQAVVNEHLRTAELASLEVTPFRFQFSAHVGELGRLRPGKFVELLRVQRRLRAAVRSGRYAGVVYATGAANASGLLRDAIVLNAARRGSRVPFLFHLHSGDFGAQLRRLPRPMQALVRSAYRGGTGLVLAEELVDDALRQLFGDIRIVANGVPDPGVVRVPSPSPTVVYVGNLHASKGVTTLLEAGALLASGGLRPRFVFVGPAVAPDTLDTWRERARGLGVEADFVGALPPSERDSVLAAATVFSFPTRYPQEAMPLVVLEAMASGLPVVASTWRSLPSVIRSGVDGLLVEPDEPPALAEALRSVLEDPSRAEALGRAARARFLEHFELSRFLERFEATVVEVVRDGRPPPVGGQPA